MDFHVGLTFRNADPMLEALWTEDEPFFTRGQYGQFTDLFFQVRGNVSFLFLNASRIKT